ncbi:MAG: TolC family protein [Hungatella sp.]
MKIKSKMMPLCLAAVLAGSTVIPVWASPEFSRTAKEWEKLRDNTLEYGELEGLIQEYNTTVLNNRVELGKETARSSEDFASKYWDAAANAYDKAEAAAGSAGAIPAEINARQAELTAENNTTSMETIRLGYEKTEKGLVMQAQTAMNSYYQLQNQRNALQKTREVAEASYRAASTQARPDIGMATQVDVLTAQQNLQSLDGKLISLEQQIQSTKQKLCVMTGWAVDANPEIMGIPATDLNRIAAMNPETDLPKALQQDYTLRIDQQKLKNATSMENTELLTQTVANDKQQIAVALTTAYRAVLQAKNAYDQAALDCDVAAGKKSTADQKYQLGTISNLELLQAQSAWITAQGEKENQNLALFQAMETYDWTVKGVRG